jgi:hypothetical protein
VEITLEDNIPEWLPMYGKKVRLYHHGMLKQCNGCYALGHMKRECKGTKINWRGYVDQMRRTGKYEDVMFGSWINSDVQMKDVQESEKESTQKRTPEKRDLRSYLSDPDSLKKALKDYLERRKKSRSPHKDARRRSRSRSPERNKNQRGRSQSWKRGGRNFSQNERRNRDYDNDKDDRDKGGRSHRGNRGGSSRGRWRN